MSSHPPFVVHEHKHQHPHRHEDHEQGRPRLPPIPDLRFELSYLRSIQPYVHIRRNTPPREVVEDTETELLYEKSRAEKLSGEGKQDDHVGPSEVIELEWRHIFWITARDQVISPLLQGALWAIISFYLTPFSARLGHSIVDQLPSRRVIKEGFGVGWLRSWVKSLGLTPSANKASS